MTTNGTITANSSVLEVSKMRGIKDLPIKVRGPFARALIAEKDNDYATAKEQLAKAIKAESS